MLMSEVIGLDLVPLDYPARLEALRARGVGLWDVVAEPHRKGKPGQPYQEAQPQGLVRFACVSSQRQGNRI